MSATVTYLKGKTCYTRIEMIPPRNRARSMDRSRQSRQFGWRDIQPAPNEPVDIDMDDIREILMQAGEIVSLLRTKGKWIDHTPKITRSRNYP